MASGIIYLAIIGMWVAYFLPRWVHIKALFALLQALIPVQSITLEQFTLMSIAQDESLNSYFVAE
jgi:hypothetical protein